MLFLEALCWSFQVSPEQRTQIWRLLANPDLAFKRQARSLLNSLGPDAEAALCASPLDLEEANALVSLLSQCPDYGLRVLEKGLSGLMSVPFGQAQFRVLVHLMSSHNTYGLKPLEMEEAAWDALDYRAQAEITAGWETRRRELSSQILHEIGGMERALPPEDILERARDWHNWTAPDEGAESWLQTRSGRQEGWSWDGSKSLRAWLGEPQDDPRGFEAQTFLEALSPRARREVTWPVMINAWDRPMVTFDTALANGLLVEFCRQLDTPCRYVGGVLQNTRQLTRLDLYAYTEPSYCSVLGRPPTQNELVALATLPSLQCLSINWHRGIDLSPLREAPALKEVRLGAPTSAIAEVFPQGRLGDIEVLSIGEEDPEYTQEDYLDEEGCMLDDWHTCEACGKVISSSELTYPDPKATERPDHNFHCPACEDAFFGTCVDCGKAAFSSLLQYETHILEPDGDHEILKSYQELKTGHWKERCSSCVAPVTSR